MSKNSTPLPVLLAAFDAAEQEAVQQFVVLFQSNVEGTPRSASMKEAFNQVFEGLHELRVEIAARFLNTAVLTGGALPRAEDRERLHRVLTGTFPLAQLLRESPAPGLVEIVEIDLDDETKERLAMDHFYSWMSGEEYVDAKLRLGALLVGATSLPSGIVDALDEARTCLALQQSAACATLTRTALELGFRDVYRRAGFFNRSTPQGRHAARDLDRHDQEYRRRHPERADVAGLADRYAPGIGIVRRHLCWERRLKPYADEIQDLYSRGSDFVHGRLEGRRVTQEEAKRYLTESIELLQHLYEALE